MSILKWNLKNIYMAPLVCLLLSIWGVFQAPKLKVNMDLSGLLSDKNPAVLEMNHVSDIVGGGGYLVVLVGPMASPEKKLANIAQQLKGLSHVKYTYFERETYLLKDKILYLLSKKEFRKLSEHAQTLLVKNNSTGNGELSSDSTGLDLFDESDQKEKEEEAREFFNKLGRKLPNDRYFLSKDKLYAMLLVKPDFSSTDLDKSQALSEQVRAQIAKGMGENFPFKLAGRYVEKVHDKFQFDRDIAKTSIISTILLFIVLFLGLGSVRAGLFTLVGVFMAMGLTIGLATFFVGRINILTGFLLAILSGLGSEYGIHFVRRYFKERQQGKSEQTAILDTYMTMGRSLFSACLTSACAFFILSISDFKGFSELGLIAGMGIVSIYFTFMCIFPFGARLLPYKKEGHVQEKISKIFYSFPFKIKYIRLYGILIPLIIYGLGKAYFEYDFERLHNFSKETQEVNQLIDELYGRAITPSAVLTRDGEQTEALESWLKSEDNKKEIDQVVSYFTVVPIDMESRNKKISRMRGKFETLSPMEVEKKTGLKYSEIRNWLTTPIYGEEFLPLSLRENFGPEKNILLVFPKERQGVYEHIDRYAKVLLRAKELFPGMEVGSDTLVFSAILNHIIQDGKVVVLLFLLGAFVVFWIDFRKIKFALVLEGQLILGCLFLVALMGLFKEPFTILNVAILPAVLAAGIDMGVHQIHDEIEHHNSRFRPSRKRGAALLAAQRISGPIHLGMLTSICGFGSLLFAEAKMLNGIGWISILGQVSMYLVCMVVFPTCKDFYFLFREYSKNQTQKTKTQEQNE